MCIFLGVYLLTPLIFHFVQCVRCEYSSTVVKGWRPGYGLAASTIVRAHCMTSKERWKTMRVCCMKGHQRAAASMDGGGLGGWEADGSGFVPSAQQKGDSRWPLAPLTLTAFRRLIIPPAWYVFNIIQTPPPPLQPQALITLLEMLYQSSRYL